MNSIRLKKKFISMVAVISMLGSAPSSALSYCKEIDKSADGDTLYSPLHSSGLPITFKTVANLNIICKYLGKRIGTDYSFATGYEKKVPFSGRTRSVFIRKIENFPGHFFGEVTRGRRMIKTITCM